jgi:hypothetical protein
MRTVYILAFAFLIIIGGLMITNLGVFCIACGAVVNKGAAVVAIVLGAVGLYGQFQAAPAAQR